VTTAYVGFGANLGEPRTTLARVVEALRPRFAVRVSSLWRTEPVGRADQPWFVNACLALAADAAPAPRALLEELLALEAALGRDRTRETPGGPRACDLDLLLVDGVVTNEPGLDLPHPRMHERAFVLAPLVELAGPDLVIPGRGRAGDLLRKARSGGSPAVELIV
jgi:2-amino-4-hydroxy-6-hydroxymethyldihydropteridine diphosphokinase